MYLLNKSDIIRIFNSSILYEKNSFFVIEPESREYRTDLTFNSAVDYAYFIEQSYKSGKTILVKNLELFNKEITDESLKYGEFVDVHMYLVPEGGRGSFDFHSDDCSVTIKMIYGKKTFEIKKANGELERHLLVEGDRLDIDYPLEHRATPHGASCLLSFGRRGELSYQIGQFLKDL
jgi:hypothetical protein